MPAKSARQYRWLQAVAHGADRKNSGMSPEKAREFIHATSPDKRKAFSKKRR